MEVNGHEKRWGAAGLPVTLRSSLHQIFTV